MSTRERIVTITKTDADKRIVYGEVYAPDELDSMGEFMLEEDVEQMAHKFLTLNLQETIDTNHDNVPNGSIPVESFLARDGDEEFAPGSWVLGVKIVDDVIWHKIRKGELNGFSMQSLIRPVEYEADISVVRDHVGTTKESKDEPHDHMYFVQVNGLGRVIGGQTSVTLGHSHPIKMPTTTEKAQGHAHRYKL